MSAHYLLLWNVSHSTNYWVNTYPKSERSTSLIIVANFKHRNSESLFDVILCHDLKVKDMKFRVGNRETEIDRWDHRFRSDQLQRLPKLASIVKVTVVVAETLHIETQLNHVMLLVLILKLVPDVRPNQVLGLSQHFLLKWKDEFLTDSNSFFLSSSKSWVLSSSLISLKSSLNCS